MAPPDNSGDSNTRFLLMFNFSGYADAECWDGTLRQGSWRDGQAGSDLSDERGFEGNASK